ncbi:MAG TPA: ABC transporter substrate-binding protein [Thermoanaerobaculia bacterium]|nr:ABC transporter substrate-binding protein [Thermoanaerobaculia bacterium]
MSRSILPCLAFFVLTGVLSTSCQGDRTVRFGAILPLSGPVEAYGTAIQRGVELAFDRAKADPELGYQLDLTVTDSEADPQNAARLLAEQYEKGVLAVVGGVTSAEAMAMVQVAEEKGRVLVSPSASSPELTGVSRNFFRVFPSDFVEGTKMANFAANTLKLDSAVIIAAESPYGRGIQGVFENEFLRHGGEMLEVVEYPPNTSDFSGLVGRLVTLEPDVVYIAAYWDDIVSFIKEIKQAGYQGKILTSSAFATPQAVAKAGEFAEGVYFTQTVFDVASEAEPIRGFVQAYRARYGEDPDLYAAHGYDAMTVMIEALRQGGRAPNEFWKGMRAIRSLSGVTGTLQFDERGDVQKFPRVYLIKDGVPVNYDRHMQTMREAFRRRLQELEQQRRRLGESPG